MSLDDDYLEEYLVLPNEQLCLLAKEGDQYALEALYKNNIGFLHMIMREAKAEHKISFIKDEESFLQLGFIGLWKAIEPFDPGRDTKFLTYAAGKIRKEMYKEAKRIVECGESKEFPYYVDLNGATDRVNDEFRANPEEKHTPRKGYSLYAKTETNAIQNVLYEQMDKSFYRLEERNRILVDARYGYTTDEPMTYRNISRKYNVFVRKAKEGVRAGLAYIKYDMCRPYHKRRYFQKLLDEIREICREISRLKREKEERMACGENKKIVTALPENLKETA